jgi:hypothetical protein
MEARQEVNTSETSRSPSLVNSHLRIFVATRAGDVPAGCARLLSVDGTVPGFTRRFDHHTTGERINLDSMPDMIDARDLDGVGTTLADMDAVASVVVVLLGGRSRVPTGALAILESASHWCDHLVPHPAHDAESNRLGRGLLDTVARSLEGSHATVSERFSDECRKLADAIVRGAPLPYSDAFVGEQAKAEALARDGRVHSEGPVAWLDLRGRGPIDPLALYAVHRASVAVTVASRRDGGWSYSVGTNPLVEPRPADLSPALRALAAAEYAHGAPARGPEPVPENENWGGRATVFGSPWNYGSRLGPEEVVAIVKRALAIDSSA